MDLRVRGFMKRWRCWLLTWDSMTPSVRMTTVINVDFLSFSDVMKWVCLSFYFTGKVGYGIYVVFLFWERMFSFKFFNLFHWFCSLHVHSYIPVSLYFFVLLYCGIFLMLLRRRFLRLVFVKCFKVFLLNFITMFWSILSTVF